MCVCVGSVEREEGGPIAALSNGTVDLKRYNGAEEEKPASKKFFVIRALRS